MPRKVAADKMRAVLLRLKTGTEKLNDENFAGLMTSLISIGDVALIMDALRLQPNLKKLT